MNFSMTINGKSATSEKSFPVINPANETIIANAPEATPQQINDAVTCAKKALNHWQKDEIKRRECLKRAVKIISHHHDELAKILTQEQGKPIKHAHSEVQWLMDRFENTIYLPIDSIVLEEDNHHKVQIVRKPLGVVAVINPWNYPVGSIGRVAIPLLLGNTVIVKPSPYTPLSTLYLGEILRDVFPAGVLQFLSGSDEVGKMLVHHEDIRKISFTGSVKTGKYIAEAAAKDLKRITLELGGNDPAIICEDVNPKEIAKKIFWGAFANSGQVCIAVKRLYVHENIANEIIQELVAYAKEISIGDGLHEDTQMGPLNNKMQLEKVTELVNDAIKHGAKIHCGGARLEREGYFYPPTIVSNIKEGIRLVDEEQFGPVLPIMTFSNIDDVIARANATSMGLGATVWAKDWQKAYNIAREIESGSVWVNQTFAQDNNSIDAPFGGVKSSGLGREGWKCSLDAYSEWQTLSIAK